MYPNSFTAAVNSEQPRTWLELLFLSFTSMSSTGLGDNSDFTASACDCLDSDVFGGDVCGADCVAFGRSGGYEEMTKQVQTIRLLGIDPGSYLRASG